MLGLGVALLLWRDNAFQADCLALLLIPVTVTPLVVGLVFRALLAPDYGMIGYYLAQLGISVSARLLRRPSTALGTLVFVDAWQWTPFMALILLAGLKSLPTDVLEAAEADGATPAQRFRIIVLPMLLPAVFLALVLRTMDAFRVFDIILRHHQRRPGRRHRRLDDLRREAGPAVLQHRLRRGVTNMMIACILFGGFVVHPACRPPRQRTAHALSRRARRSSSPSARRSS